MTMKADAQKIAERVKELETADMSNLTTPELCGLLTELCGLVAIAIFIFFVGLARKIREWWRE